MEEKMILGCLGPDCKKTIETVAEEKNFSLYTCSEECKQAFNDELAGVGDGFHFPMIEPRNMDDQRQATLEFEAADG